VLVGGLPVVKVEFFLAVDVVVSDQREQIEKRRSERRSLSIAFFSSPNAP